MVLIAESMFWGFYTLVPAVKSVSLQTGMRPFNLVA